MPSIDDGYANAATTKAKVSYSGGGNQKTPAEKAADKERARLKKIEEQRTNLSSEVNKSVRPATPIKSTAVTTPLGSTYKKTAYDIAADKAYLGNSGKGDRAVSPSITSLSTRDGGTSGSIFDMSRISGISSTPKSTSLVSVLDNF